MMSQRAKDQASVSAAWAGRRLWRPGPSDNKYTKGVVLLATGSPSYPGAAVLGVLGAAMSGAGYVRYLGPERCENLILQRVPEAVMGFGHSDVAVIGSGWDASMTNTADAVARDAWQRSAPLVVDAGALPGVREWASKGARVIATPHPGEAVKMLQQLAPEMTLAREDVEANLLHYASLISKLSGAVVVLKSSSTVVAEPGGRALSFDAPSPWGGTAGAGDVLAGVIATFVALGTAGKQTGSTTQSSLLEMAMTAVVVHGLAAGVASGVLTDHLIPNGSVGHPALASNIAECLPDVVRALLQQSPTTDRS